MRTKLNLIICLFCAIIYAQDNLKRTFTIQQNKELVLKFDFPNLIKVTTWDKNEVEITGKVNISNGENNSFFVISEDTTDKNKVIEGKLNNYKDLPQTITTYNGKEKFEFNSKEEMERYAKNHNITFGTISYSAQVDIVLEIKVPRNQKTQIEATYGTIEIKSFDAPIYAKSTYGSVDAEINESKVGKVSIENYYGNFYTNLNLPIKATKKEDFHTIITASLGKGSSQEFSSKFGNVYLRK